MTQVHASVLIHLGKRNISQYLVEKNGIFKPTGVKNLSLHQLAQSFRLYMYAVHA